MRGADVSLRERMLLCTIALAVGGTSLAAGVAVAFELGAWASVFSVAGTGLVCTTIGAGLWFDHRRRLSSALRQGIEGLRDGEYSLRVRNSDGDASLGKVVARYNEVNDLLREHSDRIRQRELLVDAIVDHTGTAVVVVNEVDRVVFASRSARQQFFAGERIEGLPFSRLLESSPAALREAVANDGDALVALDDPHAADGEAASRSSESHEHLFVQSRHFQLNGQRHRLVLVRPIGMELRRQELDVWKRVVRVISHELNGAMTPVSSLLHSARVLHQRGAHDDASRERLARVLESVAQGVTRLRRYVEGYANFARLPAPNRQLVNLANFVESLAMLAPFRLDGEIPSEPVSFDSAQVQQALLNLLRNAAEAGSPVDEIRIRVRVEGRQLQFDVRDRGPGMDSGTMRKAVLPFFSTKSGGSGLGLAVAREVAQVHGGLVTLMERSEGGLLVRLSLGVRAEVVVG